MEIGEKGAQYWIERLELAGHPEGGYFAPAYRSPELLRQGCLPDRFSGDRCVVSSIYYLVEKSGFSAFHRIRSVEIWNFCAGSTLSIHVLDAQGNLFEKRLGKNFEAGELFHAAIEPGCWFGAEVRGPEDFSLVTCTVAPGFNYEDFELARREELAALYPQHLKIIERLTR